MEEGRLDPAPIWSDVSTFDGRRWRGVVDCVTGGFPCQDISNAGQRAGIEGARSGLWSEFARIIHAYPVDNQEREVTNRWTPVDTQISNTPITIRSLVTEMSTCGIGPSRSSRRVGRRPAQTRIAGARRSQRARACVARRPSSMASGVRATHAWSASRDGSTRSQVRCHVIGRQPDKHGIIREVEPGYVFVENVAALAVRGLDRVLADLATTGARTRHSRRCTTTGSTPKTARAVSRRAPAASRNPRRHSRRGDTRSMPFYRPATTAQPPPLPPPSPAMSSASDVQVCPGSGTLSPTWQGVAALTSIPTHGECGICNQDVRIDGYFNTVVHGWKPTRPRAGRRSK
jgi:hypothetical protein